jgi:sugar/nucleoside kinase (ribokinase family)
VDIDVLVLGGAGVDTVVYVPELPLPFADSYLVPVIETRAGQTGDNVAVGVAALGLRTLHIDVIGDDPEGDRVRALHAKHGVALTDLPLPAGTKRAVNLVDPTGRRLSLYDGTRGVDGAAVPVETVRELALGSRHAHVCITEPWGHALPILLAAGLPLSTDLHNWDGTDAYHETFAFAADLVFLSATALPDPRAVIRRIAERGRARVIVATDGPHGAYLWVDGSIEHVPAVAPSRPVIDSNGAGDAFVSGFLYGWLDGLPARRCAKLGAVAGAYACTVPATRTAAIGRAELLAGVVE